MYQIAKNKLNELYGAISAKEDLFLPVQKAGQTNYGLWTEEAVVDIDTLKTVKSGKDCFFPQSEVLYKSRYEGGKVSIDPAELQNQPFVVTKVTFRLQPGDPQEIAAKMEELAIRRREKQPLEYPSAGSTFKRPEGYFAGKLIMDAGLRGKQIGGARVSDKHCGFIINTGNATAEDVKDVIWEVQRRVKERFHVDLEPEIKML